jgi:hypothetical protein
MCGADGLCAVDPARGDGGTDSRPIDASFIDIDSGDGSLIFDIAHVSASDEATLGLDTDYTIAVATTINTTTLTANPSLPAGVGFVAVTSPGGPSVAMLDADMFAVNATLTVTGSRPLIVVARTIQVAGAIDAGAKADVPGAGGAGPGSGTGAGQPGQEMNTYEDGGGGGGGFGAAGGVGGTALTATGGTAGGAYGNAQLSVLQGGSGGGAGRGGAAAACRPGGAGGGAIQLSAFSISITGAINAGGGGGAGGGSSGTCAGNYSSAAGGGSGGAIYLQTDMLLGGGSVAANGGGGGEGGDHIAGLSGTVGADATSMSVALGGAGATDSGDGGNGGTGAVGADTGKSPVASANNGGGGGGGPGRIYLQIPTSASPSLQCSPACARN